MSGNQNWETPPELFEYIERKYLESKFDYDLCASKSNTKCEKYFSKENSIFDASYTQLQDKNLWCNPPYSGDSTHGTAHFVSLCHYLNIHYRCTVALLLPTTCTSSRYFQTHIGEDMKDCNSNNAEVYFLPKRIKFISETGATQQNASFSSMVIIFRGAGF